MSNANDIIIWGASGYTGKLIAESLYDRNLPFTAAGRNADRINAALEIVAERAGASVADLGATIETAEHTVEGLTELFSGAKVVINVTGPFTTIGEPVVQAALNAGCHYIDTTGEQDFMLDMKAKFHEAYAEKGLLLAPATAYMWLAGSLAAEVALEDPTIDSLDIAYFSINGTPSVASAASFMRMIACPHYHLKNGELVEWERAVNLSVTMPYVNQVCSASAWGGAAEPSWYVDDERVNNCKVVVAFDDSQVISMIHDGVRQIIEASSDDPAARDAAAEQAANQIFNVEPPKESPEVQRAMVNVQAWGRSSRRNVQIHMHSPYFVTGELIAESARNLLTLKPRKTGFQSAAVAIGHRTLLGDLMDRGFITVKES